MKAGIVYYSFTGNTQRVCEFVAEQLKSKGYTVTVISLKPQEEEHSFFRQGMAAFTKKEAALKDMDKIDNLADYNFVIFASPVWAFTITPALRTYLNQAQGLHGKCTGFILTYGSGVGVNKARRELKRFLKNKGATVKFGVAVEGKKTHDQEYLKSALSSFISAF